MSPLRQQVYSPRANASLLFDWDVHHGNGTEQIFWDEPNVLYVSTHQWPLFPGSGSASEVGGRHAIGRNVNIPLPPGATGDVILRALNEIASPIIEDFDPTWVLVFCRLRRTSGRSDGRIPAHQGDFALAASWVAGFRTAPRATVVISRRWLRSRCPAVLHLRDAQFTARA